MAISSKLNSQGRHEVGSQCVPCHTESMHQHNLPLSWIKPRHRLNPVWTNAPLLNHASPIAHRNQQLTIIPAIHLMMSPRAPVMLTPTSANASHSPTIQPQETLPSHNRPAPAARFQTPTTLLVNLPHHCARPLSVKLFGGGTTKEDDHCGTSRDGV
jgi:hypothetical protein